MGVNGIISVNQELGKGSQYNLDNNDKNNKNNKNKNKNNNNNNKWRYNISYKMLVVVVVSAIISKGKNYKKTSKYDTLLKSPLDDHDHQFYSFNSFILIKKKELVLYLLCSTDLFMTLSGEQIKQPQIKSPALRPFAFFCDSFW